MGGGVGNGLIGGGTETKRDFNSSISSAFFQSSNPSNQTLVVRVIFFILVPLN